MNQKTGTACRIRNPRLMGFGRLILLAMLWPSGLYLLLGGVEPFSGLLCLFAGIWLLLENPLEFLAAFSAEDLNAYLEHLMDLDLEELISYA